MVTYVKLCGAQVELWNPSKKIILNRYMYICHNVCVFVDLNYLDIDHTNRVNTTTLFFKYFKQQQIHFITSLWGYVPNTPIQLSQWELKFIFNKFGEVRVPLKCETIFISQTNTSNANITTICIYFFWTWFESKYVCK